jgi:hypothetical protein
MSFFSVEAFMGRAKKAWTSPLLITTPGDPLSIRKLDTISCADGGVLMETCSHEVGTAFYAIDIPILQITLPISVCAAISVRKLR